MAAAATLAAKRAQKLAEADAATLRHMSHVELIRHERAERRKMQNAESPAEIAKLNHEKNLDPALWPKGVAQYLYFARLCDRIAKSQIFSNLVLGCIIVAGALVGMQTYSSFDNNAVIKQIDQVILGVFTFEVLVKVFGEGMAPLNYFWGLEYAWNIFDFSIVLLSMPFIPFEGGQLKLLRLIRLMRLAKAFRKIPQLQMIIMGLVGGLKSIVYIVVLMLLIFYLYACAGILFFKGNDPFHFKSVEVSMLTLLGIATLDGWGQILFLNYFGCDVYPAGFYTTIKEAADPRTGGVAWCGTPNAQPITSVIYFVSFIVLASFCILSLFIGAVAMSMVESMNDLKAGSKKLKDSQIAGIRDAVLESSSKKHTLDRKSMRRLRLIELAFQGQDLRTIEKEEGVGNGDKGFALWYRSFAYACEDLAENDIFGVAMTCVIILAGVTVGIGTDPKLSAKYADILDIVDMCIQYTFLFEIMVKMLGEEYRPYRYFRDSWNCFDFIVVAGSFLPSGGSLVTVLRLLRLLRVLKLLRALPQLQVIVSALLKGASAIIFITILLAIFYYFFGIIAITFLGENDAWHFGSLHMAMLTLFQCSTLDNWSSTMWISLYGCDVQNGGHPELCGTPSPHFALATFFFLVIILVGALVLLTLFIGVVGMSMDEASQEQKKEKEIEERALMIGQVESLDEQTIRLYKEVFDSLDLIHSTRVGSEEMKFGLTLAGLKLTDEEFHDVWSKVDRDSSNGIDFAEFLEFMCDLKCNLRRLTNEEENFTVPAGVTAQQPEGGGKKRREFSFISNSFMATSPSQKSGVGMSGTSRLDGGFGMDDDDGSLDSLPPDARMFKQLEHHKPGQGPGPPEMTSQLGTGYHASPVAAVLKPAAYSNPNPSVGGGSDKQKVFSVGREMSQALKKDEPGSSSGSRVGDDNKKGKDSGTGKYGLEMQSSPESSRQERERERERERDASGPAFTTPKLPTRQPSVKVYGSGSGGQDQDQGQGRGSESGSPPLQKVSVSPSGERHAYSITRAQSSFEKVPFGLGLGGAEDGSGSGGGGPESPVRIRNAPSSKSPYAPGSSVKKPVKSLVVSI